MTTVINEIKAAFDAVSTDVVLSTEHLQLTSVDNFMAQLGYARTANHSYARFDGRDFIGFDIAVLMHNGNINARVLKKVKNLPLFQKTMEAVAEFRLVKRAYLQRKGRSINCVKQRVYFNI